MSKRATVATRGMSYWRRQLPLFFGSMLSSLSGTKLTGSHDFSPQRAQDWREEL